MIDIENEVFTKVATALRLAYPGISVYGEMILNPASFPFASIEESDNYTDSKTIDSGSNENHAIVMYEVNVFSNKKTGRKAECKQIFGTISDILTGMGFVRTTKNPINMADGTAYRIFGRFSAVVSADKTIYRR